MAEGYFSNDETRAERVQDLFEVIASRYDFINDLQSLRLHRYWKRRLISLANPLPGQRALDLCCGTGDVAFGLAAPGVEVIGMDFSQGMLEQAAQRPGRVGSSQSRRLLPAPRSRREGW